MPRRKAHLGHLPHLHEPPINLKALDTLLNAGVRHNRSIGFKVYVPASTLNPNKCMLHDTFKYMALDFLTFGNGNLDDLPNCRGKALAYTRMPLLSTRREPLS
ncbi:Uncharacterised protein [Janthinobacterium lividum]|nr:hypothetical protein JANLI_41560 [Janthinobacterium lividum]STS86173.1 Uncharacterised protein [Janthinobacterium lividum]